jgi:hypothetical protein
VKKWQASVLQPTGLNILILKPRAEDSVGQTLTFNIALTEALLMKY